MNYDSVLYRNLADMIEARARDAYENGNWVGYAVCISDAKAFRLKADEAERLDRTNDAMNMKTAQIRPM